MFYMLNGIVSANENFAAQQEGCGLEHCVWRFSGVRALKTMTRATTSPPEKSSHRRLQFFMTRTGMPAFSRPGEHQDDLLAIKRALTRLIENYSDARQGDAYA